VIGTGHGFFMNLAACGGTFFDRINKINMIFLFFFIPACGRQVLNILSILSKKWDFLYYQARIERLSRWILEHH
jgi:hypothetical protein